jgi:hypothetical protein
MLSLKAAVQKIKLKLLLQKRRNPLINSDNSTESSANIASAVKEEKVNKTDKKVSENSDAAKDEKGCCSTDKMKKDQPAQ